MCEEMEKIYSEGRTEGLRETAAKMLTDGLPVEKVSAYSGLILQEVTALKEQMEQDKK